MYELSHTAAIALLWGIPPNKRNNYGKHSLILNIVYINLKTDKPDQAFPWSC